MSPKITSSRVATDIDDAKPYGPCGGPNTWRPVLPTSKDGSKDNAALITCAAGHECILSCSEYTIAPDRTVTPTYVCPFPGCGLKSDLTLKDGL